MAGPITTPLTITLGIKHPIILAGMRGVSGGRLAASLSNAGGLGVVGGLGYNPKTLEELIIDLKRHLSDPDLPFGISVALNQHNNPVDGDSNNYDNEIIDLVIKSRPRLMISTLGAPGKQVVDRLHESNILVMKRRGTPKTCYKST